MKKLLSFFIFLVITNLLFSQSIPVAVNDTITTISEHTIAINVLLNDYDPDGYEIEIKNVIHTMHGGIDFNDSTIFYTPELYVGIDSLSYRIREVEDHSSVSEYALVYIIVNENPDIPLAVDDNEELVQLVPTELYILENDSDPNGEEYIIDQVRFLGSPSLSFEFAEDSLSLIVTSGYPLEYNEARLLYRIKEKNTENAYYSDWAVVTIDILENTDIPTTVEDVANITGGETVNIYVLENDINPSGLQLEIESVDAAALGSVEIVNDHLNYTANYSQYGIDILNYKIRLVEQPYVYAYGTVVVNVANNPGRPVAVDDEGTGICGGETTVEVLQNDFDPEGAEVEIKDVRVVYPTTSFITAEISGNTINVFTGLQDTVIINSERVRLEYRVQEVDHPESYSEWAKITIDMEQNPDYPILLNDYGTAFSGFPSEVDIFANDMLNGYNPTFNCYGGHYGSCQLNDKLIFTSYMATSGLANITYSAYGFEDGYYSFGEIEVEIEPNKSYDSLDINNINAGIHSDGFLFDKTIELINVGLFDIKAHFEYPKGSGKHTIFCNSLWIGGVDQDDNLHLAAQRYKQVGIDYQFGPISNSYEGLAFFTKWNRVWKLNKEQISYHRNNYWKENYEPVEAIINWPGNGTVSNGQAEQLAPYSDLNENGIYEPMSGDYPLIRGDQSVFFIYNDDRIHTETEGGSMEVEIHGMAYAFDETEDNLLNNTVFVHYDIINRSENTYYNTYFGTWTDIDLGYAYDDFVGCNVELGSYYGYNGKIIDGNGEPGAYGVNPPTQGVTIVAGPFMDEDNIDNPDGGCDNSINGLNFGDNIVDNERLGMTGFVYHNNQGPITQSDPRIAPEYYNYLRGIWKDNTKMQYGGTAHSSGAGTVGPECDFMFPGDSDPCNWGTDGELPNEGYNQNGKYWTEETGDNGNPNPPADRRGIGTTGPFTFDSGERQELELAFSVGQGEDGPYSSSQQLFENLNKLFQLVEEGEIITPSDQLSVNEQESNKVNLKIYPNPVKEVVYIQLDSDVYKKFSYRIYNNLGKPMVTGQITSGIKNSIEVQNFEQGLYIIEVQNEGAVYNGKFIKM